MSSLISLFGIIPFKKISGYSLENVVSRSCTKVNDRTKIFNLDLYWESGAISDNFFTEFEKLLSPTREITFEKLKYSVIAFPQYASSNNNIRANICICEFKI